MLIPGSVLSYVPTCHLSAVSYNVPFVKYFFLFFIVFLFLFVTSSVNRILSARRFRGLWYGPTGLALLSLRAALHFICVTLRFSIPPCCCVLTDKVIYDPPFLSILFWGTFSSLLKVILNYLFQIGSFHFCILHTFKKHDLGLLNPQVINQNG